MGDSSNTLSCRTCSRDLPDDAFPLNRNTPALRRGRDYKCRECKATYYRDNKARMLAQCRTANIRARYGISAFEYDALISEGCRLCGTQKTTPRSVVLDHCHATGRIRGALCHRCNIVLGMVGDDATLLRSMADHVE